MNYYRLCVLREVINLFADFLVPVFYWLDKPNAPIGMITCSRRYISSRNVNILKGPELDNDLYSCHTQMTGH
jgi:hypothetical protein